MSKGGKRKHSGRKSRESKGLSPLETFAIKASPEAIAALRAKKEESQMTWDQLLRKWCKNTLKKVLPE